MGLFKALTINTLAMSFLFSAETAPPTPEEFNKHHVLYLVTTREVTRAITNYLAHYEKVKKHDFVLLEQIASMLLESGIASPDPEEQLLAMFGISLCQHPAAIHFLESGMNSRNSMVQAASLHLLARIHEDVVDAILMKGLKSDFLMIRFESLHYLITRHAKNALGQVESLSNLLHPQFRPMFVEFYALHASQESIQILKQMLNDKDINVRIAATLTAAKHNRDDLLGPIRALATHTEPALKEAAVTALGALHDLNAAEILKIASELPFVETKLAALAALYKLGHHDKGDAIIKLAEEKNLFAIALLSDVARSEPVLKRLLLDLDENVRLNAAIALLHKRDSSSFKIVRDLLITDTDHRSFVPYLSPGKALLSWRTLSPAAYPSEDMKQNLKSVSRSFQEELLQKCIDLPEEEFLSIANAIMKGGNYSLIPLLIRLLEVRATPGAKQYLKDSSQKLGSPLVRAYCNLALFRMGEGGEPQKKAFLNWLSTQKGTQLIEFKPMMDRGIREDQNESHYQLTPEETSAVLIESLAALAERHEEEGITFILEAIKEGHPKNRSALAGLLLKAIQ